jgi:outer membrane protein assembly factor BamA
VFSQPEPSFLHSELSVTADRRDFPEHPTRGGLYRAAAINYSDRDSGLFSFRRYEAEAAQFVPLMDSRVVIALHGWLATSDTSEGDLVPFYLMPSLGGHNSLRSFDDYRFHDRNMLVVNAEARVAMMTHVDAAVFFDAGNVAPRVGDLDLDKKSVGAGVRFHTRSRTYLRLDVANGDEGWRVLLRLTDPLNLMRLTRRTATAPFVH